MTAESLFGYEELIRRALPPRQTSTIQPWNGAAQLRANRAHEALDRVTAVLQGIAGSREGFVTVYDSDGIYAGCMGINLWRALLDAGATAHAPALTAAMTCEEER